MGILWHRETDDDDTTDEVIEGDERIKQHLLTRPGYTAEVLELFHKTINPKEPSN